MERTQRSSRKIPYTTVNHFKYQQNLEHPYISSLYKQAYEFGRSHLRREKALTSYYGACGSQNKILISITLTVWSHSSTADLNIWDSPGIEQ